MKRRIIDFIDRVSELLYPIPLILFWIAEAVAISFLAWFFWLVARPYF